MHRYSDVTRTHTCAHQSKCIRNAIVKIFSVFHLAITMERPDVLRKRIIINAGRLYFSLQHPVILDSRQLRLNLLCSIFLSLTLH